MSLVKRRYKARKALLEAFETEAQIFRAGNPTHEEKIAFKKDRDARLKQFEKDYPVKLPKPPKPDPAIALAETRERNRQLLIEAHDRNLARLKFENAPLTDVYAAELQQIQLIQKFDNLGKKPKGPSDADEPELTKPVNLTYAQKIRIQRFNNHIRRQKREELALIKTKRATKESLEALRVKHEEATKQFYIDEDVREEKRRVYFQERAKHGNRYHSNQSADKIEAEAKAKAEQETSKFEADQKIARERFERRLKIDEDYARQEAEKVRNRRLKIPYNDADPNHDRKY